jgi:hypothetical protein
MYCSNDGTGWTVPRNISQTSLDSNKPQIKTDGGNNIHVVWRDDESRGVYHKIYSRSSGWSPSTKVSPSIWSQDEPDFVVDASGIVHLIMVGSPNGNQDVCYLRLDGAWSFIRNISDDPQNSYHPKILLYANRVLHVLWHDDRTYDVLHRYFR